MRWLGAIGFLLGAAGTAYSTWAVFNKPRPADVAFAVLAPTSLIVALAGLLSFFVPDFWG